MEKDTKLNLNELYTRDTSVLGYPFEDIEFVVSMLYAVSRSSNTSLKDLSKIVSEEDLYESLYTAVIGRSEDFELGVRKRMNKFGLNESGPLLNYSESAKITNLLTSVVMNISREFKIGPSKVLHTLMQSGLADFISQDDSIGRGMHNRIVELFSKTMEQESKSMMEFIQDPD